MNVGREVRDAIWDGTAKHLRRALVADTKLRCYGVFYDSFGEIWDAVDNENRNEIANGVQEQLKDIR